jgi:phosphocarrier protein
VSDAAPRATATTTTTDPTNAMPAAAGDAAVCSCPAAASDLTLRRTIAITNARGLHARAAAKLVTLAEQYSACLNVVRDGQRVPACSIMGLMMLGAGKGSQITIEADGWDAKEALEAVAGLVEAGFHED